MSKDITKVINGLVQDELSAVETYRQAIEKVADEPGASELRRIVTDHEEAVSLLQEQVSQAGGEPASSAGVWGAWARAVEGTAKLLGNKAAIKALKEGEEHGVHDYERALRDSALDESVKTLIRTDLLPRTKAHIPVLDALLSNKRGSVGGSSYNASEGYGPEGEGRGV
jgi:uncharacterized protein (TIGR02284 family)